MMNFVIDKSFLDGVSTEQVRLLCRDNVVLFSETLLYELLTTREESQKKCFSKLFAVDNPITVIPGTPDLLRYELNNGVACTPLANHAVSSYFNFNARLREGTYLLEGEQKQLLEEWKKQVTKDTNRFLERCSIVYQFFPELNGIEYKAFPAAIDNARKKIAEDHDLVRSIYKSFLDDTAPDNAPSPESLDPQWAFFRFVQCQVLSALKMFGKYQGNIPLPASRNVFRRAEHTMHDIYYTILATLSGALATRDQKIIDDFLLACPQGVLIS